MICPLDLKNILPQMNYSGSWQSALMIRDENSGKLVTTFISTPLPGVQDKWCSLSVDFLRLKRVRRLAHLTATYNFKKFAPREGP